MIYIIAFAGWLMGAVFTSAAIGELGTRNANTIGDSFSGDDALDMWLIVLWPMFWPCYIAHRIGRLL